MTLSPGPGRNASTHGIRIAYSRVPSAGRPANALWADDHLALTAPAPEWYPLHLAHGTSPMIVIEGRVYGGRRGEILGSLARIPATLDDDALVSALRAATESVDGDFAVVWYDAGTSRMAIAADRMGRLPLYHHVFDGGVMVARDQVFVLAGMKQRHADSSAIAELLLLGYPLGRATLTTGMSRLLPREVIVASPRGVCVAASPASPFRRQDVGPTPRSIDACARALRDAFVESCRQRVTANDSNVLSLSGGIDSRTTGAGMRAALDAFHAVTFVSPGSGHADERGVASTLAGALGVPWRAYPFDSTDPSHVDGIVRMKLGLNPADVAFGIDYVRRVHADFPAPVSFWTGEGADKLLCEHRSIPPRPNLDQLTRFVIEKNAIMTPRQVRALTGVNPDDLAAGVHAALAVDRAIEPGDAYAHFLLAQRVVRFHCEGEDRHRAFVWPLSPFFGADFVSLARSAPARWKRERRLYRAFLCVLAPDVAALPLAGGHPAPASTRFWLEYALRDRLRNNRYTSVLHRWMRTARSSRHAPRGPWHSMLRSFLEHEAVPSPLSGSELRRIADGSASVTPSAAANLLTTVMALRAIQDWDRAGLPTA